MDQIGVKTVLDRCSLVLAGIDRCWALGRRGVKLGVSESRQEAGEPTQARSGGGGLGVASYCELAVGASG
jgi:hypothetical protein